MSIYHKCVFLNFVTSSLVVSKLRFFVAVKSDVQRAVNSAVSVSLGSAVKQPSSVGSKSALQWEATQLGFCVMSLPLPAACCF